jgi:hypothetical protein
MSGKVFEPTKKGIRELTRYLDANGPGTTVYTEFEAKDWGIGPERLYNDRTFAGRHPLTKKWIAGHLCPAGLLAQEGRVYTEPPRGVRYVGDPAPQVAGPLGRGNTGDHSTRLDDVELRGLEKRLRDAPHPRTRRN